MSFYNPFDPENETAELPVAHLMITDGDRMLFYAIKGSYIEAIKACKNGVDQSLVSRIFLKEVKGHFKKYDGKLNFFKI